MEPTTIRLDAKTRKQLNDYCAETGAKMSDAFRVLIQDSLDRYNLKKDVGFTDSVGPAGLMLNEKRAIRASIESTLILRKLATSLLNNESVIDEIDTDVSKILTQGWQYDNKS